MGKGNHISPEMRYEKECAFTCRKELKQLLADRECGLVAEEFDGQYECLLEESQDVGERIMLIVQGVDLYADFRDKPGFYPPKKEKKVL